MDKGFQEIKDLVDKVYQDSLNDEINSNDIDELEKRVKALRALQKNINKSLFSKKLRQALADHGLTLMEISRMIGVSSSSLSNRLVRGKFSMEERERIVGAIGAKYECKIILDDGREIIGSSFSQMVRDALMYRGMTQQELADKLGKSKQALSKKMQCDKFTDEEIQEYVGIAGSKYSFRIYFDDGKEY